MKNNKSEIEKKAKKIMKICKDYQKLENKENEIENFKEEAFRKYTDKDFVKDIESIFIAYGKKEVRKIGLVSLIKQIEKKERKRVIEEIREKLLKLLGENKPAQRIANQLVGFIYEGLDKIKENKCKARKNEK